MFTLFHFSTTEVKNPWTFITTPIIFNISLLILQTYSMLESEFLEISSPCQSLYNILFLLYCFPPNIDFVDFDNLIRNSQRFHILKQSTANIAIKIKPVPTVLLNHSVSKHTYTR